MRTKHTAHSLPSFPVYSSAFVSPNELVLGGGGGQSKTGIKNKLVRTQSTLMHRPRSIKYAYSVSTTSKETRSLNFSMNSSSRAEKMLL